jgi:uncharacterized membrane protein
VTFLAPLFLIGLAALAIPVLLHLIQRERKNVVVFPSLMFLSRIPYQSVRRRRIRNWLLLLMRLAALALVVLAFARPFVRRTDPAAASGSGAREIVVLVDRSYSMGYGDRWERALGAARDAVERMQSGDRASIVLFASGADVSIRSTADRGRLLSALSGIEPSAAATHYGPPLKLAASLLSESALPRREVILISDFQRVGWQGADGLRLPDGAALTPISVTTEETANVAVTPVALERTTFSGQERVSVTAGVVNHGSRPIGALSITLEADGRPIQTQQVRVDGHASASTTFTPVTLPAAGIRGTIRIAPDALERDNAFHFVVAAGQPVRVVVVGRPGDRDGSLYLSRALAVGESPRFEVAARAPDALSADDLQNATLVVVNDVQVNTATADRLARFVERGGGLLIAAGERGTWPRDRAALVPATVSETVDRTKGQAARLVGLEYGHSIFEPFRAPRSGDFSTARFYGYRAVTPSESAQILARFDDGAPALLEGRRGQGRILLWTSSLDLAWNDLAIKPVFLPFVHQMARHLASYREPRPWLTVGEVLDPQRTGPALARGAFKADQRAIVSPSGRQLALDAEGPDVVELEEQGFYEIRYQNTRPETVVPVASNVDLKESDPATIEADTIVAAATGRAGGVQADASTGPPSDAAQESAQRFWWYLLFAGLVLLAAETVVANRNTL